MENSNPVILSIITVVYNNVHLIEATILSVLEKKAEEIEYIIIDGGSKDGTVDIIKRYESKLAYWISEADNGIYDAMNKAVTNAKGDYLYFINCGDVVLSLPLGILKHTDADMLCFPVQTSRALRKPSLGFTFFVTNTLPHQGIFYKNSADVFFDCSYKVFADYALNIDYKKKRKKIKIFDQPIVAYHELDGVSNNRKKFSEFFRLVKRKSGIHILVLSYLYFKWKGLRARLQ